jgi:hypothetical protein
MLRAARGVLTPLEVLSAATARAGEQLGLAPLGRLVEGAPADLIGVRGNPLEQLKLLEYPDLVVSGVRRSSSPSPIDAWLSGQAKPADAHQVCSNTCSSRQTPATSLPSPSSRSAWASLPTTCSRVCRFLVAMVLSSLPTHSGPQDSHSTLVWAPLGDHGVCESGNVGGVELLELNRGAPA